MKSKEGHTLREGNAKYLQTLWRQDVLKGGESDELVHCRTLLPVSPFKQHQVENGQN